MYPHEIYISICNVISYAMHDYTVTVKASAHSFERFTSPPFLKLSFSLSMHLLGVVCVISVTVFSCFLLYNKTQTERFATKLCFFIIIRNYIQLFIFCFQINSFVCAHLTHPDIFTPFITWKKLLKISLFSCDQRHNHCCDFK